MTWWPLRAELQVIRQALELLSRRERRQLALLLPPMLLVALFEMAGVASLAPFIALLSEPERYQKHRILRFLYTTFAFSSLESLFFAAGAGILLLLTVGNSLSALTTWALLRFSWARNASLSTRLLSNYLHQPYPFFLERNTADLMRKSLSDAQSVAMNVIWQTASLVSRLAVIVFITATLVFIDPMLACGTVILFGGVYGLLFLSSRRWSARAGRQRMEKENERFRISMEALSGAKEVKFYRLEDIIVSRFRKASQRASVNAANQMVLGALPRYALETVAFGGVLVMVLYLLETHRHLERTLPILGLYAFASVRLLPALQAVFGAVSSLGFNSSVVGVLRGEFDGTVVEGVAEGPVDPLSFEKDIRVEAVSFSYKTSARPVLDHVSVTLERGEWVVFIGPTGSGKSTLADVVLGLLEPTSGTVSVDGIPLTQDRARAWRMQAAYVPQQIFLIDDTVEANICFGIPPEQVDPERLERAARLAQIHEFITTGLPHGYQTLVGDRGVRLSGGQRQRVGIARALYREPKVLMLDEATSALDGATEAAFFAALRAELHGCTVVSITHRMSTAKSFDRAYCLENGVITGEPSPEQLARPAVAQTP